jgi:hypothetical protein
VSIQYGKGGGDARRQWAHQRGERHADVRRAAAPPQPLGPSAIGIKATAAGTLRRALCLREGRGVSG